jgi:hypothetical protein
MKKLNLIISSIIISLLIFQNAVYAYSDVANGSLYFAAINYLTENGVVQGYSDGTFKPFNPVNRVEFLKIVYLAQGLDAVIPETSSSSGFSDVDGTQWYAKYIAFAKQRGTIEGYPDGTFKPGNTINRAEATKIILNEFFGNTVADYLDDMDQALKYTDDFKCEGNYLTDVAAGSWYEKYVMHAHKLCLYPRQMVSDPVSTGSQNIMPGKLLNRGETAEIVYRSRAVIDNDLEVYTIASSPAPIEEAVPSTALGLSDNEIDELLAVIEDYDAVDPKTPDNPEYLALLSENLKNVVSNYILFSFGPEVEVSDSRMWNAMQDVIIVPTAFTKDQIVRADQEGDIKKLVIAVEESGLAGVSCVAFIDEGGWKIYGSEFGVGGSEKLNNLINYADNYCDYDYPDIDQLGIEDLVEVKGSYSSEYNYYVFLNNYLINKGAGNTGMGTIYLPIIEGTNTLKVVVKESVKHFAVTDDFWGQLLESLEGLVYSIELGEEEIVKVEADSPNQIITKTFEYP